MPQGRRKVPFSGKAKKQQLQNKKLKHFLGNPGQKRGSVADSKSEDDEEERLVQKLNFQKYASNRSNRNRYALQFHKETEAELAERKELARKALDSIPEDQNEIDLDLYFPKELSFPVRPPWDFSMSKEVLDAKENRYFTGYLKDLESKFTLAELSYFELNLETWRQLWRVLEMSDIILVIVDIRFSALMFPPSLYDYAKNKLGKEIILVLNKIDLVPASLVVAWKSYFLNKFPNLHIIMFTSLPGYNIRGSAENRSGLQIRRRKGRLRMSAEGAQTLLDTCKNIVKGAVDLSAWQAKITEEMNMGDEGENTPVQVGETVELKKQDTSYEEYVMYQSGTLTIGCVGQPNVGKSSLLNALMGKKVVSVSRTPGHTKHFQTIYLTKNVRLCDCPGLVFPSKVPKTLQVLMGSFPIAQLREPYSCIRYIAERINLVSLLKIQHPENDAEWSAMDICDGWAQKKRFYTARAARLDSYRGANHLLRMTLEGKIPFYLYPPGYVSNKGRWEEDEGIEAVRWIQAKSGEEPPELGEDESESDDSQSGEASGGRTSRQSGSEHESTDGEDSLDTESPSPLVTSKNKFFALEDGD